MEMSVWKKVMGDLGSWLSKVPDTNELLLADKYGETISWATEVERKNVRRRKNEAYLDHTGITHLHKGHMHDVFLREMALR